MPVSDSTSTEGKGGLLPYLFSAGSSAIGAITKGGPKRQYKYNKKAAQDANKMNRENQIWALEQNQKLLDEQRKYDSVQSQMARYRAAGLNPNLIYDQGANSTAPIQIGAPQTRIDAPEASLPDVAGNFQQAMLTQSQLGLNEAKTNKTILDAELTEVQRDIAKTNPMLNPSVAQSVTQMFEMTARAKRIEMELTWTRVPAGEDYTLGHQKIRAEVEALNQKLGLNTADLAIKNRILESKEYENAVKEINARWLQDGTFTPEHIRQGLMMFLSKMAK